MVKVALAHHFDVAACKHALFCRICMVAGGTEVNRLPQGAEIGDHHAVKAHVLPQDIPQQTTVGGAGLAVDGVEGRHDHAGSSLDRRAIGDKVVLKQRVLGQLGHVVVTPCLHRAVGRKVLDAGGHFALLSDVIPLKAPHHALRHAGVEPGILAGGLHAAAPATVPAEIDHGREGHMQSGSGSLPGGNGSNLLRQCRIEAGADRKRHREDGLVTMDHVHHEQRRNMVWLSGHHAALQVDDLFRPLDAQQAAHAIGLILRHGEFLHRAGAYAVIVKEAAVQLYQLLDLLL